MQLNEPEKRKPTCTILAGPNGAGKSTLFSKIPTKGHFINADEVARDLNPVNPEKASLEAGRVVIRKLDDTFKSMDDFTYETTLSSRQSLHVLTRANQLGYETLLLFVALNSSQLHVKRVEQRVLSGGHHIAEDVIRRRYEHSFENLALALALSDSTLVFDNSGEVGPELLIHIEAGAIISTRLDPLKPLDQRVAVVVARGIGIPKKLLFPRD